MKLKQFFTDDDAVSPVIGVILMVAITVILAAVIASFVLGLGDSTSTTPQASFDFDYSADDGTDPGQIVITHESGDSLDPARVKFSRSESLASSVGGAGSSELELDSAYSISGDVTAGTSLTVAEPGEAAGSADGTAQFDDLTLRIIYTPSSGDSSSTLATWEGPDA